jgi:hypothetical protein
MLFMYERLELNGASPQFPDNFSFYNVTVYKGIYMASSNIAVHMTTQGGHVYNQIPCKFVSCKSNMIM